MWAHLVRVLACTYLQCQWTNFLRTVILIYMDQNREKSKCIYCSKKSLKKIGNIFFPFLASKWLSLALPKSQADWKRTTVLYKSSTNKLFPIFLFVCLSVRFCFPFMSVSVLHMQFIAEHKMGHVRISYSSMFSILKSSKGLVFSCTVVLFRPILALYIARINLLPENIIKLNVIGQKI